MNPPELIHSPAPWSLVGKGYVILVKLDPAFVAEHVTVPDGLKGRFSGGIGTVMFVDYLSSDVGPYRELLFVPGMFSLGLNKYFSITRIYVSTMDSVVNGRNNWGIPKELAEFEVTRDGHDEIVRVGMQGRLITELVFHTFPGWLPVTTALVPPRLRTLAHHHEGKTYLTTPFARGVVSPARLIHAMVEGSAFPDFTRGRFLGTLSVPKFLMAFPEATIL